MSDIDLDAIRARANAATESPWTVEMVPGECRVIREFDFFGPHVEVVTSGGSIESDARFIAHARADIPALLALVESLTAELATANSEAWSDPTPWLSTLNSQWRTSKRSWRRWEWVYSPRDKYRSFEKGTDQ